MSLRVPSSSTKLFLGACIVTMLGWSTWSRPAGAGPSGPRACTDPAARAATARSCIRFNAGYARFQTAMTAPNTIFEVTSDEGLEVIMFDDWIVIVGPTAGDRRVVPRERFVYAAEEKFE